MTGHANKTYMGQRVVVDGNQYEKCDFRNCMIVYQGGQPPSFKDCRFDSPQFSFDGAAGNTVTFIRALSLDPGMAQLIRELLPELFQPRR